MVRALLDANVLISAAIRPSGVPGRILTDFLTSRSFELVLSTGIVAEAAEGLGSAKVRGYLRDPEEATLWLADIAFLADVVEDTGSVAGVARDPEDDKVLAAAVEGRVEVIVSGDHDLLTLGQYEGITIMTPRAFLDRLEREQP